MRGWRMNLRKELKRCDEVNALTGSALYVARARAFCGTCGPLLYIRTWRDAVLLQIVGVMWTGCISGRRCRRELARRLEGVDVCA